MRVGVDLQPVADIARSLERYGDRYRTRIFTPREVSDSSDATGSSASQAESLAARFAAKEATFKALRVHDSVPLWTDVEVVREEGGWPSLRLHGVAEQLAREAGLTQFQVSLSHTADAAIAIVIATE